MASPLTCCSAQYLLGATEITITDPYIRRFHQARNLMELIEGIAARKDPADEVVVKLITSRGERERGACTQAD